MGAKDRNIIIYNNLTDLINEISVPENYHLLINGIIQGKSSVEIASELGVRRNRIYQMYWQYVKWCREHTDMVYHEDFPPISREEYDQFHASHRRLTYQEELEALKQYILSKQYVHPAGGNEFTSVKITPSELEEVSNSEGWGDICKGWEE